MRLPVGVRYLLVGGTCLLSNNIFLIVADRLHQPLLVGVTVGFFAVGALGFQLHCRFTFETAPTWHGLACYMGVMAVNTPLSIAFLWVCSVVLSWPMTIAAPIASIGMIVVNFLISRAVIVGRVVRTLGPATEIAGDRQC